MRSARPEVVSQDGSTVFARGAWTARRRAATFQIASEPRDTTMSPLAGGRRLLSLGRCALCGEMIGLLADENTWVHTPPVGDGHTAAPRAPDVSRSPRSREQAIPRSPRSGPSAHRPPATTRIAATDRTSGLALLRAALNDPLAEFRDGQWEAIDALVNRRERTVVVQRTGWGKSSVYFIATRMFRDLGRGPTLIVSPLLALMRNQMEAAARLRIDARSINSTNRESWPALTGAILNNEVDAVLVSPERLASEEFVNGVLLPMAQRVGLVVVDEVHCISDWGHDFRPDYRRLVNLLQRMPPNVPVLGTTATANDRVISDIVSQLGDVRIQRGPLTRESLALQTVRLPDQTARLAWLAEHVPELPGTGVIYTLTKHDADLVARWLNSRGTSALAYYSNVMAAGFESSDDYRQHLEEMLLKNDVKALVATTALSMGYDKPDLGFVVHYQAPGSIIAYYQQVGRAGRAIPRAVGILLGGEEDAEIHEYFRDSAFPDAATVDALLGALSQSDGLTVPQLEKAVDLRRGQILEVLNWLAVASPSPVMRAGSQWRRTPTPYTLDAERIAYLTARRLTEWKEVQAYIDTESCLMQFLAEALDDPHSVPCGKCAQCLRRPIVEAGFDPVVAADAANFLKRTDDTLKCKVQVPTGAFAEYGFYGNLPEDLRAQPGRTLSRWGDAGWGKAVAADKHMRHFRDELVEAVAEMIRRWDPQPAPVWVTCVPSRRHPDLVPDFARRVAVLLGLPLVDAVRKVRDSPPQKTQQNAYHQSRNLDGVFAVVGVVPGGPVLLLDDIVDSAWTMTVVAALLRRAGSSAVWPVALARATGG